jgi:pre-mRNA-splicing factor ATP-dependent RNA helicase DHX38/PRP16
MDGATVPYTVNMTDTTSDSLHSIDTLPIYARKAEIVSSVEQNQVTIITAETGAGKSTQVPQFLAESGYSKVIVTQPRILAARNLCGRVRQELSWRRGTDGTRMVGYRTAHERDDDPDNVILYCTDGLQLVRELTGSGTNNRQVLVLDEIHEWNENMEVLLAWAKKRCTESPDFKIVLMSATIEADILATYFGAPEPIHIEGRHFQVEKRYSKDLVAEIETQLEKRGSNVLVFLPGKAEIEQITDEVTGIAPDIPIIPLHSQLEPEAQQLAFQNYPSGKLILSTNIAQTSITIDDIDVVIDSGLERRVEVRNGVEGLFISEVSQADCLQRAGRAGRTRPGAYILARLDRMPCAQLADRPAYGIPEIMRKHIDRLVLRLANIGIDIEDLDFFHSPSNNTIKRAKRTLASLGALKGGTVTDIGHQMERFPVESSYGRMLVESKQYSDSVRASLATIIAIQEVGGIVKGGPRYKAWRRLTKQTRSDLLAQYDLLLALPSIPEEDYEETGIIAKNVDKAIEVRGRLLHNLSLPDNPLGPISPEDEEPILKCIVAGQLHQIWLMEGLNEAVHLESKKRRELSSTTVVKGAGIVAGTPFDLEVPTPGGLEVLHLVNDLTVVNPAWLQETAPDSFKVSRGQIYFDPFLGTLAERKNVRYRGRTIDVSGTPVLERTGHIEKLFISEYAKWVQQQLEKQRKDLASINFRRIPSIPVKQIEERVRNYADGAISVAELPKAQRIELHKLARLENWLDQDFVDSLNTPAHNHNGKGPHGFKQRRRGWNIDKRPKWRR